jgi:hypothetical protein
VLGNVREWVDDRAAYYDYEPLPEVSLGPKGPQRGRYGGFGPCGPFIGGGGGAGARPRASTPRGGFGLTAAEPKDSLSSGAAVGITSHLTCDSLRAITITART